MDARQGFLHKEMDTVLCIFMSNAILARMPHICYQKVQMKSMPKSWANKIN